VRSFDDRLGQLESPEPEPRVSAPGSSAPAQAAPAPQPTDFETQRAMSHVAYLARSVGEREQGTAGESAAALYVREQLSSYGYVVTTQSVPIPVTGRTTQNVIALLQGTQRPGRTIVLGAHIDTKGGPGANDNATGVGVLLELARVLRNNMRQVPAVEFAFFGGEEIAAGGSPDEHHWGSQHFLDSLPPTERERLAGMISVDMVGAGEQFYVNNMGLSRHTLRDMLLALGSGTGMKYRRDPGWSDHEPFETAGVPSAWLEYTGGNPYHEPADDYSSVDQSHVGTVGALMQRFFEDYLTCERTDQL
jgi:aminopeptidase S